MKKGSDAIIIGHCNAEVMTCADHSGAYVVQVDGVV